MAQREGNSHQESERKFQIFLKRIDLRNGLIIAIVPLIITAFLTWMFTDGKQTAPRYADTEVSAIVKGRKYSGNEVQIGNRSWMPFNLDVDTFRDGVKLIPAMNKEDWKRCNEQGIGCYCEVSTGKIYNYAAALGTQHGGIAPMGFQLIDIGDLEVLRRDSIWAPSVKTKTGWKNRTNGESGNGNNSHSLYISPTGYVTPEFEFVGQDSIATFWMLNESRTNKDVNGNPTRWYYMHLQSENDSINWDEQSLNYGYAVRCVRS